MLQPTAQSITLVFEDFLLTYDDDFLFVRDGSSDAIAPGDTQARALPFVADGGRAFGSSPRAQRRIGPKLPFI